MRKYVAAIVLSCFVAGTANAGLGTSRGLGGNNGFLYVMLLPQVGMPELGQLRAGGDIVLSPDVTTLGARVQYSPAENLAVNGSAAVFSPDQGDDGQTLQGGISYLFHAGEVELATRAGFAIPFVDNADLWIAHLDFIAYLPLEPLPEMRAYASAGVALFDFEHDLGFSDDGAEPMVGAGVEYSAAENVSITGGVSYMDDPAITLGFKLDF